MKLNFQRAASLNCKAVFQIVFDGKVIGAITNRGERSESPRAISFASVMENKFYLSGSLFVPDLSLLSSAAQNARPKVRR